MSEYERGYVQALRDIRAHVKFSKDDRDTPHQGKEELGIVTEFLDRLIATKEERLASGGGSGTCIGGG